MNELVDQLNTNSSDFVACAQLIADEINSEVYGTAKIETATDGLKVTHTLTVTTGGWSECELVMSDVSSTIFHMRWWESSHRGGKFIYKQKCD